MDHFTFDAEYLRRLREGDPMTSEHFVSYFDPRLKTKLWKRGFTTSEAKDIIQETYKRVFEKLQTPNGVRSPERFGAFVVGVCRNAARERRRDIPPDQLDPSCLEIASGELSKEQILTRDEARNVVRRTLGLMKPRDAQILIAVFVTRQPKDEICDEFGIKRENLRVIVHRAIARFKFFYKGGH